jgi:DNA-binding response OmpR family regulator
MGVIMEQTRILVVEDDEDINNLLRCYLERAGYETESAFSGTEAKLQLSINTFHLILLDLMIPGITGEELIQVIRKSRQTPILVISVKSGADDYMTKPFEREEVLARVEALLRRCQTIEGKKAEGKGLTWKELEVKPASREVLVKGKDISLTAYEYDILLLLLQHPERVFTKDQLYQEVWKTGYYGEDNTINVHISNIRKKIKDYDEDSYIKTVWGIGFKIDTGK